MAATITWTVQWMNSATETVNGYSKVVLTAGWICTGTQEDSGQTYNGSVYSSASFTPPPPDDPNFVPYASLTQEDVLNWIWSSGVDKEATEAAVQQQIDLAINPPEKQYPLPWAAA